MKHFLDIPSWSYKDLWQLIQLAVHLKNDRMSGGNSPVLKGKTLAMVFQKPSLRTRVSFEMAMKHLGGDAIMLGPTEIGLGKRESVADIARVLSGYVDGIMARVFDHQHVVGLAEHSAVPVINGLSDDNHPCQAMADMLTIYEHFHRLRGLTLAYIGDGNNVAASLLAACAQFGVNFSAASPEGHALPAKVMIDNANNARRSGIIIEMFDDPKTAILEADVVYTDTWTSMGQEDEAEKRLKLFQPFQVNGELLKNAKPTAVVLHCLPAHRGQEITDEVADGPQSLIFQQAENRMHAQKAILVNLMG
jgi:ornithine carbamoyltransferase